MKENIYFLFGKALRSTSQDEIPLKRNNQPSLVSFLNLALCERENREVIFRDNRNV